GRLADEMGIDPSPRLRRLQEAMSHGEVAPTGMPAPCEVVPAQLPRDVAGFTGRITQLARLNELLSYRQAGQALVISAIAGTEGVGKTALAGHWAHQVRDKFPDGQLYVDLRGFDPVGSLKAPGDALRGFLDALRVPPKRIPADLDARADLYRRLLANR